MAEVRKDLVNQEILAEFIKQKEQNYLAMLILEVETPIMLGLCEKAKQEAIFEGKKERADALEKSIVTHKSNFTASTEAKDTAAQTIDFLKSLKA